METWNNFTGECLNYIGILIMSGIILLFLMLAIIFLVKYLHYKKSYNIECDFCDDLKRDNERVKAQREYCANLIIENNQTIEDLQDKLKKSENRCACAEGKLKKIRGKQYAMNFAINLYNHYPTSLKEHFDNVIDLLKEH